ncbi:MAG: histidine kinase dimerization/phospho-acceptor domain-containing protein [Pseudobdellovibrionaceae bacterium]
MPSLNSSVLILGLPSAPSLHVGADIAVQWKTQKDFLSQGSYDVVCAPLEEMRSDEFEALATALLSKNPTIQMVLVSDENSSVHDLQFIFEKYPVFRIIDRNELFDLEKDLVFGLEEAQMAQQEQELETLVREQNEKLKQLYQDLEDRVRKRQNFLLETRRKTYIANARWESLRETMIAIYQSTSIGEMEKNLLAVLQPTLQLESIRILLKPHDQFLTQQKRTQASFAIYQAPLFRSQDPVGSVLFIRNPTLPFQREEADFLVRVSEAASLALDRQTKLEESETLKEQWQATFNAVSDPVALINQKYELVQTNSAFLKKAGLSTDQIMGQKCFQILFQRESPCLNCELGKNFRLDIAKSKATDKVTYDVYSQPVPVDPLETTVFVNLYHDVTEQIRMERKILESARLAEIGTIGSSIAHELNNPLGGILSFVQLIKMDLKPGDELYEDISSMEEGVRRCKDIVQNLLGFTRNPEVDEEMDLDLRDVLQRAAKIVELQTKSRGIEVKLNCPPEPVIFRGHLNLLSQAVRNLLQSSIDSLIEKSQSQRGFQGLIELRLDVKENEYSFNILDNGLAGESAPSLSLSVAGQIIHDYGGHLEISSRSQPFRLAKFTLPRPVFQA